MTNQDYWNTFVGESTPEDFLRSFGTADPELALERFLEDRGQLYGVVNQQSWEQTFSAPEQFHVWSVRAYLRSYLEDTRDDWAPALEAKPPKVVRRYRPVYDLPTPDSDEEITESDGPADGTEDTSGDTESEETDSTVPSTENGPAELDADASTPEGPGDDTNAAPVADEPANATGDPAPEGETAASRSTSDR